MKLNLLILVYLLPLITLPVLSIEPKTLAAYEAAAEYCKSNKNYFIFWGEDTPSMRPSITGNNWLIVETLPIDDLKIGDVIIYSIKVTALRTLICHRIIGGDSKNGFIVKGDNEKFPDGIVVTKSNYVGKMIKLYNTI